MAGIFNFTGDNAIQLGETFTWNLVWKSGGVPVNLTNRTARMQWRKNFNATETIAEFSTVLGNLTLGGALGTIAATLTAAQTAVISAHGGVAQPVEPPVTVAGVPAKVPMRQARLALLGAGLLANVNAAIAAMPGVQGEAARIEWEYSNEVRRSQSLVLALGPTLGLTSEQLDALFVAAAKL